MIGASKIAFLSGGAPPDLDKMFNWGPSSLGSAGDGTYGSARSSPVQIGGFTDWSTVSDFYQSLAIRGGRLYSCGYNNNYGGLGLGNRTSQTSYTQVGAATDWQKVAAGGSYYLDYNAFSAGIRGGGLFTWGYNANGELGSGSINPRSSPVQVGAATDWTDIWTGTQYIMGIRGGALWVWGSAYHGGLGRGVAFETFSSPVQVGAQTDWTKVVSAGDTSFGIRGGKLYAWGDDTYGCLGLGTSGTKRSSPVQVGAATDWTWIGARAYTALGIRGGQLYAWGLNDWGQLGLGDRTNRSSPVPVGAATDWTMTAVGGAIAGALNFSGGIRGNKLFMWGAGNTGQLGLGSSTPYSSPVQVGAATDWEWLSCGDGYSHGIR